jgi:hypothetical protein
MGQSCQSECKCSGSKELPADVIELKVATVDFYKVQNEGYTHFCFDGVALPESDIIHNINIGKKLLQGEDKLVVCSKYPLAYRIENNTKGYSLQECFMEDSNYYIVISKQ